jgi:hypothetical protein
MNPGNGASSSILPGSEEGIGGRHGLPGTLAGADVYNARIASPSSRRWRGQRRRRFCRRTNSHHFGAAAWHIEPVGAQEGKPIPLGWALDREGHPTTDPKAGLEGPMLPAGARRGRRGAHRRPNLPSAICRTKMSACQGYRRRDLAHSPGRKD